MLRWSDHQRHEDARVATRPLDESGREIISIKSLLEWSFATECASLDYDEVSAALGIGLPGVGAEYRIGEQLALGARRGEGVRPDTSMGRSQPHDDADLVATMLRNSVEFSLAVRVAELARSCRVPRWDLGHPRILPREWRRENQYGRQGKTDVIRTVEYVQRGRKRSRQEIWTPCVWIPTVSQIAAARRDYLDWWGALLSVAAALRSVELTRFVVSGQMPPLTPWRNDN